MGLKAPLAFTRGHAMTPYGRHFLILIYGLLIMGTNPIPSSAAQKVFVSIQPQKYFVEQIGQEYVQVHVMVAPGASPATYEPKPRQMTALSQAGLYFAIGVPFEKIWLAKLASANPAMRIVPTDQGIIKRPMSDIGQLFNNDNNGHHDQHGRLDPHIWLAPSLVKLQARHIFTALCQSDPMHTSTYEANYNRFIKMLDQLDFELRDIFKDHQGLAFMVFHPSWGYFAQAYGLKQISVEMEGKEPKPAQMQALIQFAQAHAIRIIFVQPQFSRRSAIAIAEAIGGEVVIADPLAYDWPGNLRRQALQIKAALK